MRNWLHVARNGLYRATVPFQGPHDTHHRSAMTTIENDTAADHRPGGVHHLSDELSRLMRVVHALKTQVAAGTAPDDARERAADVLLFPLVRLGPLRQSALAELVHADPSTISRHVTLLVDRGLVRRVADAHDGRATQLVVTDAGHAVLDVLRRERETLFAQVTQDWTSSELTSFTALLHRFVDDLTGVLPALAAAGHPDHPSARPTGTDPTATDPPAADPTASGGPGTRHTPEKDR